MGRVRVLGRAIPSDARAAFKPLAQGNLTDIERRMIPQMRKAFAEHMNDVVNECLDDTSISDSRNQMRSALLRGIKVYGTRLDNLRTEVFAPEYIHAHEYGATIRPKSAKALTIPLPAALRPDGSPKFRTARAWKRYGTFSYKSKKTGRGYLAYKNAAGKLVLLYVFVNQSRVMPRLGLRSSYDRMFGFLLADWGRIMVKEMAATNLMGIYTDSLAGKFGPTDLGFRTRKR
jgi:hypothetical protein